MLNRVESTECSRTTTIVYLHEYHITLPVVGTGQMSRLNARCLPIGIYLFTPTSTFEISY